jgi:hypothetical protein
MKIIQNPDGTIQIINEEEKPDGYIEELNIDSIKSEVSQSLINECEELCKDGYARFIFDKHISNISKRNLSQSESETRDINISDILEEKYYISTEEEFNLMPSRFPYYDTETKMTCRWSKHKMVIDWLSKLGFEPGLSNMGPEFEQSFVLSVNNENGSIIYKCILRIQPNLFVTLIAEYGDFIENKKTVYKGFFKKSEILRLLDETSPDIYKMIVREVKLEEIFQ